MAVNIEIKARVRDRTALQARAEALSSAPPVVIVQEDTFFHVPQGRLKLRELAPDQAQLVYYERPDQRGPKRSQYFLFETDQPAALKMLLSLALGTRGVVRKVRTLYRYHQTRIHLDEVEGLGTFVELEVVLHDGQSEREGYFIARQVMHELGIADSDLIENAYIDLLEARTAGKPARSGKRKAGV